MEHLDAGLTAEKDNESNDDSDGSKNGEKKQLELQVLALSASLEELKFVHFAENAHKVELEEHVGTLQAQLAMAQEQTLAL